MNEKGENRPSDFTKPQNADTSDVLFCQISNKIMNNKKPQTKH